MARLKKVVSNEMIMKAVDSLNIRMNDLPTKDDVRNTVEKAKEEILEILRPIERAVDKDAVTIVNHERRITRIEERLSVKR